MSFDPSTKKQSLFSQTAGVLQSIKAGTAISMLAGLSLVACGDPPSEEMKAENRSIAQHNGPTVIVSTFAGSGPTGIQKGGFADGPGNTARFDCPIGITIDTAGNLYVADSYNDSIRKVTPEGEVSTLAGDERGFADGQGSDAMFWRPHGITIDAAGNLYVADTNNSRIRKVTIHGEVSTLAGGEDGFSDGSGSAARFYIPDGIAMDATGNLYVADTYNHRIRKVTLKGEVSTLAGSGEEGFADGQGNTAVFNHPRGIAIDVAGNLYVADFWNHRIRKITIKGEVSTLAGSGEIGVADGKGSTAQFNGPEGIAIDAAGNLYVTDSRSNRIRMVTPEGEVSTLAGSDSTDPDGEVGGFADGEGSVAKFDSPSGIAIDAAGNLYVTDSDNYRIRKIVIQRP